jgi:hypothetical protein
MGNVEIAMVCTHSHPVFHCSYSSIVELPGEKLSMAIPVMMQRAQEIIVDPEDIIFLVKEMTKLREEGRNVDWATSIFILRDLYESDADKMFCVSERMRCLSKLMKDPRMKGWTIEDPDPECIITNHAVFRAVAKCMLRFDEKRTWFDADEFFRIVLEECDAEGTA